MTISPVQLDEVRKTLAQNGATFGNPLMWHASVESTMPLAWQLADDGSVRSGAAVVADEQTAGKGRQGRTWVAPPALGILVSFMLRREDHPVGLNRLHMAAALAIADLCRHAGIAHEFIRCKWPNDVVLLDAFRRPRKVAGILVETRLTGDGWASAVVGTGINVNQVTEELPPQLGTALPATSLRLALASSTGTAIPALDRADLFVALCRALSNTFTLDDLSILEKWRALLWIPAGQVIVSGAGREHTGEMLGADDEGALLLREMSGNLLHLAAGDLSLRPLVSP